MGAFVKIIDLRKDSDVQGEIMAGDSIEALREYLESQRKEPVYPEIFAQDAVIFED